MIFIGVVTVWLIHLKTNEMIHFPLNDLHSKGLSLMMARLGLSHLWMTPINKPLSSNCYGQKHCFPDYSLAFWHFSSSMILRRNVFFMEEYGLGYRFSIFPSFHQLIPQPGSFCKFPDLKLAFLLHSLESRKYICGFTWMFYSKSSIQVFSLNSTPSTSVKE